MNRLILAPLAAILCHAQPAPAPDGHWAGAIQLPGQELRILVDLVAGPPWQGHISIPAQGLKDFPLSDVKGDPAIVGFRLPGIPGDPTFTGRYDGGAIRGTFSQGGMTFPFILERKAPEALPQPPQGVTERDLACGTEPFVLPGTLALPAGKGPWPAVVLVHGSGPNDRDENVGSNAPFRDLAWGLAARGIVVYRYDKRTRVHPKELRVRIGDKLTVQEETVLDAADAAALLRRQPGVDPSKVFVLGHSLGAMCLPRIGTRTTFAAGYIALAGPNRPLEDLIVEQMEHLGAPAAAVADMKVKAAHVKDLEAGKPAAGPLPLTGWTSRATFLPRRPGSWIVPSWCSRAGVTTR